MLGGVKLAVMAALAVSGLSLDRHRTGLLAQRADAPVPGPSASPTPGMVRDANGDLINLDRSLGRMTVKVQLGDSGSHDFTIDTGAQRTTISSELAGRLGYQPGPRVRLISMSGAADVGTVHVPLIQLGGRIRARDLVAPTLDPANMGAAGMIGVDALAGRRVVIDMKAGRMLVAPSSRMGAVARRGEIVVEARRINGQLILTDAFFGDTPVRVIVDTGSQVTIGNLALQRRAARAAGKTRRVSVLSVTGGEVGADYGTVRDMWLGNLRIRDMPVAFADVEPFAQLGLADKPALLLGMDMIRRFDRVEIDFQGRQVRFSLPAVD